MADLRVLAVDNNLTMRRIIVNTLRRIGYSDVVEASNGKDALAKLKVEKIDFVVTDWNMPEMDGLEFVTTLRSIAEYKDLSVLMVTVRSAKDDVVEALKAGVNSYIVKPFTANTLKQKIEQMLFG